MTGMIVSLMTPSDIADVSDLVRRVFDAHVAPSYPQEGCDEFYRFIAPVALREGLQKGLRGYLARDDGALLGVLVLRDTAHVSLFFVETDRQRRGIGRLLMDRAASEAAGQGTPGFSVNASPNAVGAYVALGFLPAGPTAEKNGITFVPMARPLDDYAATRNTPPSPDVPPLADTPLPGPAAFLVSGYNADAREQLRLFLGLLLDREPRMRPVTAAALGRPLQEFLADDESDDPLSAEQLPRVVLFSGCTLGEARRVVGEWKASGLPRPIFAAATDSNLHFSVRDLLGHLLEEHRSHGGRS
ncbi:MAG: hypothetical protein CVU65_09560 [Deltaproteobacteria bacterium HGW-Deltaproteobacteria-22]|jgi:GNAT superfamily N-acetyltransferase|nr:MAG: hypothetical protein CVU65_09560 [Deltaproteobacteria bacterium HGW-Deltaproteobacteria-22]